MSYESPIEIAEKMSNQIEKDIIEVVLSYGIKVDKDELVKALSYDRKQYEIGYADGQRAGELNFCPNCGADMREDIPIEYFENGGI